MEEQATTEAEVVVAAMAGAAAMAEAVEAAETEAVEAVIWATAETATRRPEIVIGEQSEQPEQELEGGTAGGAQEMGAETAVEAMNGGGEGASGEECQASSKIFDPGKLKFYREGRLKMTGV